MRIRAEFPEFEPSPDNPPLFVGEMMYPWMFEEDRGLAPMREAAEIVAQYEDWPVLYDIEQLRANSVPVAAAVYYDDMALDEPEKKMSKSGAEASYIALLDTPDVIRKKVARATTDSQRDIVFDENRPGIYNLLTIYQQLGGESKEQIEAEFAGKGYKEFKAALADRVVATLEPIQQRFNELFADHAALDALLAQGAEHVRPLAVETLRTAKEHIGLL